MGLYRKSLPDQSGLVQLDGQTIINQITGDPLLIQTLPDCPSIYKSVIYEINNVNYVSLIGLAQNSLFTFANIDNVWTSVNTLTLPAGTYKSVTVDSINNETYISVSNTSDLKIYTYVWNGTAYVSSGTPVEMTSEPTNIEAFNINNVHYIIAVLSTDLVSLLKYNGTTYVAYGTPIACGTFPIGISIYSMNGTWFFSVANGGGSTINNYYWTGTGLANFGSPLACTGTGIGYVVAYRINGLNYLSATNFNDAIFDTFVFDAITSTWNQLATTATGDDPAGICFYSSGENNYINVVGFNDDTLKTYTWNGDGWTLTDSLVTLSQPYYISYGLINGNVNLIIGANSSTSSAVFSYNTSNVIYNNKATINSVGLAKSDNITTTINSDGSISVTNPGYLANIPFTPVDASGADIVLTINLALYSYNPNTKTITIELDVTYNSTSDVTDAKIGGLPISVTTNPTVSLSSGYAGNPVCGSISGTEMSLLTSTGLTAVQNVAFSGASIRGTFSYFAD